MACQCEDETLQLLGMEALCEACAGEYAVWAEIAEEVAVCKRPNGCALGDAGACLGCRAA
jgi:hypothetical protein